MPRRPRLELPGVRMHTTHRGVNRCAIFIDDEDRHHYLRLLGLFARDSALEIHAYVLMGNHDHLLAGSARPSAAAAAMRRTTQCYVQCSTIDIAGAVRFGRDVSNLALFPPRGTYSGYIATLSGIRCVPGWSARRRTMLGRACTGISVAGSTR